MQRSGEVFKREFLAKTPREASTQLEIPAQELMLEEYTTGKHRRTLDVTLNQTGKDTILTVPLKAQAGYRTHYFDLNYDQALSAFTLPNFASGTYRAFEGEGSSIQPSIRHGDYVICSFLENWKYLKPGYGYVVVTHESS